MSEAAATSERVANFPPGVAPPTAAQREAERIAKLKDPAHLKKLAAALAEYRALPKEERDRRSAEKKAAKAAREAAKRERRLAKNPPAPAPDSVPPTVRSTRSSLHAAPPISEQPRAGAMVIKGLLDLCAAMPQLGSGSCFIQVTRVKPVVAFNIPCAGVQKPIWEPIDDAEFSGMYGGGEYSLRGYSLREDGRSPKALTEPVPYRVTGHPNIDAALTEEDMMRNPAPAHQPVSPFQRRPAILTPQAATAEADMHARDLEHRETMDQRNREAEEERRRRTEQREQQRERGSTDMVKILAEAKEKEADRLRDTYERQLEAAKGNGLGDVAELIKALKPDTGSDQKLSVQHASEIRQLAEGHKNEMIRLTDQHREELQRIQASHQAALVRVEDLARLDRERMDKLVRETEQRANDLVRAAEQRSDQRVTDVKNADQVAYNDLKARSEERVADQNNQWQRRYDDLKEAHAREMRGKDSELNLMRSNMEGNTAVILNGKDTEISRLKHDLKEAKEQAEKNKDWLGKMSEFEKTAEAMGFEKGGGDPAEEDVKTTAMKAGLSVLQRLPELVTAGADAIGKIRNPGVPPEVARAQARQEMARGSSRTIPRTMGHAPPVQLAPLAFATEEGGYTPPADQQNLPPPPLPGRRPQIPQEQPAIAPLEQSATHAIVPATTQELPQQQQQLPFPQAPMQQPAQQPPPQATLAPNPAPAPSAPPPAPAGADDELDPGTRQLIEGFLPSLMQSFAQRETPEAVAKQIIEANGVAGARMALTLATIDQLLLAVNQNQNPELAALRMRNGQKFLRACWAAAEQQVQAAPE